ncbi:MBL fold metallo-hydrolase [Govanella unica]|uniref:MBL fold metallo-hydrolase n=1 Tax=Govanella unica TaxID=2975056 RepID=A0A9X3Z7D0_9PROT|nr:MBL fold metallo-hydrolase [Govania unica]
MKTTILGCGTSGGVPRIGNVWGRCDPANPKNRRRRVSILVEHGGTSVLVDTSPDLREQCLDADVRHLDAVLYTHDHADHTHGIDDLRGLSQTMGGMIDVYSNRETLDVLQRRFDYVFESKMGYPAICNAHEIKGPFRVGNIDILPFEQLHGDMTTLGFRFGPIAYSTDVNVMPDAAFAALEGVDTWIVDALRYDPHPTHPHLDLTLEWIARVKPRRAILTHMTWDMDYEELRARLPAGVEPAYDGMTIEF